MNFSMNSLKSNTKIDSFLHKTYHSLYFFTHKSRTEYNPFIFDAIFCIGLGFDFFPSKNNIFDFVGVTW